MRILILGDAQSPHILRWVRYFAYKRHEVHLLTFRYCEIENVIVHNIQNYGFINISPVASLISKFGYVLFLYKIKKMIYHIKPDILHAHWGTSYGLLGAFSGFHPFILSTWGNDIIESPKNNWFMEKLIKYNLDRADVVTSTSKMLVKETKKYIDKPKQIYHIPFGVDMKLFTPKSNKNTNGPICIGTVKALEKKYGIEILIRAFNKVLQYGYDDIGLLIVGSGSLYTRLKKLTIDFHITNHVIFTGKVHNDEVVNYLHKIDIFVVPSISESETFGVAAVEASACALPVIASQIGGLSEVVIDGETGILVEPNNVEALSNKLLSLLEDPLKREELGKNGRKFVEYEYSWEICGEKMENIYIDTIKSFQSDKQIK